MHPRTRENGGKPALHGTDLDSRRLGPQTSRFEAFCRLLPFKVHWQCLATCRCNCKTQAGWCPFAQHSAGPSRLTGADGGGHAHTWHRRRKQVQNDWRLPEPCPLKLHTFASSLTQRGAPCREHRAFGGGMPVFEGSAECRCFAAHRERRMPPTCDERQTLQKWPSVREGSDRALLHSRKLAQKKPRLPEPDADEFKTVTDSDAD